MRVVQKVKTTTTYVLLGDFGWDSFSHPPYGPDLAASDFHLFTNLKQFFGLHTHMGSDEKVKKPVKDWSQWTGNRFL
jgi:hypothetical protein